MRLIIIFFFVMLNTFKPSFLENRLRRHKVNYYVASECFCIRALDKICNFKSQSFLGFTSNS